MTGVNVLEGSGVGLGWGVELGVSVGLLVAVLVRVGVADGLSEAVAVKAWLGVLAMVAEAALVLPGWLPFAAG